ncbi:DUF4400 domain-containing protein [Vibrio parahaemolyticus]|jgi:hypothetical protein|uniref:DUF4400 domain-containing protein n=1 Tax=Vibrio jasicida TaxID=766224 RepID=A0AAU9QVL4_9VIBR|nr:DUF4400 domain-containing protein [Vibrio parahaemolyticus]ELA8176726.1 DUF4400 domain-containing protein [Vibrio alginolyticus]CAH1598862.1 conserved membrane hypothetical protein [Vibrio jasicida]EJC7176165.1 DUF4400 domain-containing protein [Vibrio parahaemolyticus]EJE4724604.1 DUF4400 domain-containing protein [Vibrio parahaemolyticus]
MAVSIESESKEYTLKHRAMIALAIAAFGWVIFMMDVQSYIAQVNLEVEKTREVIGSENTNVVIQRAKFLFELASQYVPERTIDSNSKVEDFISRTDEASWLNKTLDSLGEKTLLMLYQIFFRLSLLQYWGLTIFPFVVAVIMEGYWLRKIKMYEFEQASAVKQQIWLRSFFFLGFMLNLYMLLPFSTGFGQFYPPIVLIIMAFIAKNTITHVTKTL